MSGRDPPSVEARRPAVGPQSSRDSSPQSRRSGGVPQSKRVSAAPSERQREIRDPEEARRWLASGLTLMRLAPVSAADVEEVMPWIGHTLSEIGSLPPIGVVADLGRLLFGAPLEWKPLPTTDVRLRAAIRAYEDEVLGRLATDRHLQEATDAALRLEPVWRAAAVSLLCQRFIARVRYPAATAMSPAALRRLAQRPAAEVLDEGLAALSQGDLVDELARGYEELARSARQVRTLLGDAEVFALENLAALSSMAQRLAIEQMAAAAEALEATVPHRIPRSRTPRGATPTALDDETAYPIGGFSSMSTSGSLENLVTSELIYMESDAEVEDLPARSDAWVRRAEPGPSRIPIQAGGDAAGRAGGHAVRSNEGRSPSQVDDAALPPHPHGQVDLFDLRYVEGELLYYTRDEAIFVRSHRVVTFILPTELVDARVKDPALEWQRLILVLGLILCVARRLSDWLSDEALLIRVVFLSDAVAARPDTPSVGAPPPARSRARAARDKGAAAAKAAAKRPPEPVRAVQSATAPLAAERVLCELLLRSWIDKGVVEVSVAARIEDVLELPAARGRTGAMHDRIVVRTRPNDSAARAREVGVLHIGEPVPILQWELGGAPRARGGSEPGSLWQAWSDVALDLLRALV